MKANILTMILLMLCNLASAQQAPPPSEEETLEYLESALSSCSDVDSVERADVNFRIYNAAPSSVYSEFNLAEVSGQSHGMLVGLKCGRGACIDQKMEHMGEWTDFKRQSALVLNCGSESPKIGRALKYFSKHFADEGIDFPSD